jgi:TetR/AcrR family transcriptional repressor of nem operon
MDLFNTRGYHATKISDIMKASGVQKGNLYFYFKSKEALAQALVREAQKEYMDYLHANARGSSALEKLDNVLAAIFDLHVRKKFVGGCIFGNMALEMGDNNFQFRKDIRDIFDEWVKFLSSLIHEAVRSGEIVVELAPEDLARHIVAAMEGGIMLSRLSKDHTAMKSALDAVRTLLRMGSPSGWYTGQGDNRT